MPDPYEETLELHQRGQESLLALLATRPHFTLDDESLNIAPENTHCPLCARSHRELPHNYKFGSLDTLIDTDQGFVGWYCAECDDIVAVLFN